MKSLAVITTIMPMLATIQAGGIFSNPASLLAKNWTMTLGSAAIEDGIDLSDALTAFEAIEKAEEFEAQQAALGATTAVLDYLLDAIPAGEVPEYVAPPETYTTVRLRLSSSIASMVNDFRPNRSKLEAMRKDASNLSALAMGEDLTGDQRLAVDRIYDMVDRSVGANFHERRAYLTQASNNMKRIAA